MPCGGLLESNSVVKQQRETELRVKQLLCFTDYVKFRLSS
jgi:hypothetical protein